MTEPIDPDDPELVACNGPTLRELADAGAAAAIAAVVAPYTPMMRRLFREAADAERALDSVQTICGPARWPEVKAEIERRADALDAMWTKEPNPPEMSPLRAAAESVYDDVAKGRIG